MRSVHFVRYVAFVGAGVLAACSGIAGPPTGSLQINLATITPDGTEYRLRDATITVTGPESVDVFHTEDQPDRDKLSANVPVGAYSALLDPGWRLERVEAFSETDVNAQLISDNPVHFTVEFDQRTIAPLRFRTNTDEVDLSQGYDIVLDVQEVDIQGVVVSSAHASPTGPAVAVFAPDADGTASPLRAIRGFDFPFSGTGVAMAGHEIIVLDRGQPAIDVFPRDGDGNIAPTRQIIESSTSLNNLSGAAVYQGEIYVATLFNGIMVFPLAASDDAAPSRTITGLSDVRQIAIDREAGELFVPDARAGVIRVIPAGTSGPAVPTRTIGGPTTGLREPAGIALLGGQLFVADASTGHIRVFRSLADGDAAPLRVITSPATALGFIGNLAVSRDAIYVINEVSDSVDVFPINATGNVAPIRSFARIGTPFEPFFPAGIAVF